MMKKFLHLMKNRFFVFGLVVVLLFTALGTRLAYLTVSKGEYYYNMAQERKQISVTLKGARGNILDRNGIPLAVNRQTYVAQVDRRWLPTDGEKINAVLLKAIDILEKNGETLLDSIPIKNSSIVPNDTGQKTSGGFYYNFGTKNKDTAKKRYDAWRESIGMKGKTKKDLPADQMLAELREHYKIKKSVPDETARKIISIRLDLYLNRFRQDEPVKIAEDINYRTVSGIETNADELSGIQTVVELNRYYPYGESAQHIVGYVGRITENNMESYKKKNGKTPEQDGYNVYSDKYGQDGVEAYAEKWLTGNTKKKQGYLKAEVDASRRVIQVLEEKVPWNGDDAVLTMDIRLQRRTEDILKEELSKMREGIEPYDGDNQAPLAHNGAAVILDANTGEILAMASSADSPYPYDLNDFARGIKTEEYSNLAKDPSNPLFALAFQGGMEPGSVFKMLVGTAALMEGKVSVQETILDRYRLRPTAPACWSKYGHGRVNIMDALKVSCNYYFTAIGDRLGIEDLHKWAVRFGLDGPTGLELLTLDNKKDQNVVSSPEVVERNRKRTAYGSVKQLMKDKYGKDLASPQIKEIVDIGSEYTRLIRYLTDNKIFREKDKAIRKAANDLCDISYQGKWSDMEYLRTFIGQSATSVSPLAIARYVAALVNGNRVLETHIMKEIRSPEGKVIQETDPKFEQLQIRKKYQEAIKEGMHRVVYATGGPGGHGSGVKAFTGLDPSITLGGKTGTAQVVPGQVERNTAWFTAFTPYDKPEVVVVVAVPNGKQAGNAAPVARRIIEEYYRLKGQDQHNDLLPSNQLSQ
ncbi:penicillin-binding transpeptidase domain-containing protein [Eubacteriales bacterium mix99]|jgi:penicillin-binding protein 2